MKYPKVWLLAAGIVLLSFCSGCATITRGSSEQLLVKSIPTGAGVRLSNGFTGVTPATFTVPRKGAIIVTIMKEGYENQEITLQAVVAGKGAAGFAGNVLIGGLIGGGVDLATGAALSHTPNPLEVTLKPLPPPAGAPPSEPPTPPKEPISPATETSTQKQSEK